MVKICDMIVKLYDLDLDIIIVNLSKHSITVFSAQLLQN